MTLGIDIGVIKMIITHAAAVHGLDISPKPVDLARVALKRLGLIGKGTERDRRPTTDELNRLFRCFDDNERLTLPMTRIVKFAVATAMRLDEICRVEWADLDVDRRMLLIRDRKDPRNKTGNDLRIATPTAFKTVARKCGGLRLLRILTPKVGDMGNYLSQKRFLRIAIGFLPFLAKSLE
ncbi:tyrosine-type recombinase/integrase [Boseongicola sp. H5]|uniref:tyrosine-type recombinase/integrase n=1 Tax=Boseongicola sp. H5 TaxID=2763261 RepID=UPI001D0B647C